ncbi:MAG: chorismate synthase [Parvularculales bacterium]
MSHNSFGHLFRVTTWGESHGIALGCVVDGVPPRLPISEDDIQFWLERRRPGQSRHTSQRQESDKVEILSGVFADDKTGETLTTGAPISLIIRNEDPRSKDYSEIADKFRPGHGDYTWLKKYGIRDYRGGGRASARETAARVAAGAIARKIIPEVVVRAALVGIGPHRINRDNWDWTEIERNPFWCPDAIAVPDWETFLDETRKAGSSCGALIEVVASGAPVGLGAPLYGKLDTDIAAALMSINAVKGVEIGDGFAVANLTGTQNADEMRMSDDGKPVFLSNHAGGILGGISTGQDIVARLVVKPTSSILTPRRTITRNGEETTITTRGRHDPCVGIRAVPVAEAMVACVLADHLLRHRGQMGSDAL